MPVPRYTIIASAINGGTIGTGSGFWFPGSAGMSVVLAGKLASGTPHRAESPPGALPSAFHRVVFKPGFAGRGTLSRLKVWVLAPPVGSSPPVTFVFHCAVFVL